MSKKSKEINEYRELGEIEDFKMVATNPNTSIITLKVNTAMKDQN